MFSNSIFLLKLFQALILSIFSSLAVFGAPGNLDRGFGARGKTITSFSDFNDKSFAMVLQTDGKIVAAGASNDGNTTTDAALARYKPDGTLDQSFGNGGKVLLQIEGSYEIAYALKIQSDGRIVIAGHKFADGNTDFFLARFNPDGSIDNGFGTNGMVATNVGTTYDTIKAITFQTINGEEKIVAAGSKGVGPDADFVVARYNSDGTLDQTFAGGAGVTFVSWGHEDIAGAVAIQRINNEDKIVVGGKRRLDLGNGSYNDDFALVRFNSNGAMDLSFGTNGKVNTNFAAVDIIRDLVIQEVGGGQKIVAAGLGNNNFALARYHENGSLDTTFGTQGRVQTSLNTGEDQIHDLFLLPDGRLLAGGFTRNQVNGREDFAIVRYLRDGQIDPLFGSCGTITSNFDSSTNVIHSVAALPNGNTIAAGYVHTDTITASFAVAKYIDHSAAAPAGLDFDGDGRTDTAVFRPTDGTWYMNNSCYGFSAVKFGQPGDRPVPADYDGDGKTDQAVYRYGVWYLQQSTNGFQALQFGLDTDFPATGDFDDDGKADIAVWRPSSGVWYIYRSSDGQIDIKQWGLGGDIPVAADYDGDYKTDIAVWRPSSGIWYVYRSSDLTMQAVQFGQNGDIPLVTNFDGDRRADYSIFRLDGGFWHTLKSSSGAYSVMQFGLAADTAVAGDYDGDGKTDHTVYRRGTWYFQQSKAGFKVVQFGLADDMPLTSR